LSDSYLLGRELGRGGMATVYLAHDLKHDRPLALKVLHAELAATLGTERFLREVRVTARLQHPHILPVHDSGAAAGRLWYTMPFIEGESLRARLTREGPFPLEVALRIGRDVAEALDYAHRQGIVHRDIKPENILLADGQAVVADFGIARAVEAAGGQQLTHEGFVVGTPAYMSPEQAGGGSVDGRSDVYALACVVYEMLSGQPLFAGTTPYAVIFQRFKSNIQLPALKPSIPTAVQLAIEKALSLEPGDRYPSAAAFAEALVSGVSPSSGARAAGLAQGRRWQSLVIFLLVAGLLGGTAMVVHRSSPTYAAPIEDHPLIAVLPFTSAGDPAQEYVAEGVTDEVHARLSSLPGLRVIASASTNAYSSTQKPPEQIGRELGAHYLLVGKVRRQSRATGERVHLSPELVQLKGAATPTTLWHQSFETTPADLPRVEAAIAQNVAAALRITIGPKEKASVQRVDTRDPAAYESYLQGREIMRQGATAPPDLRKAMEHFRHAVVLDSSFAAAWAQLGWATLVFVDNAPIASPNLLEESRHAGERALALGGAEAEARQVLAYYQLLNGNRAGAMQETTLGLQADPSNARLTGYMASFLELEGRWTEALEYRRKALTLDPAAAGHAAGLATNLLWLRRHDEARIASERYLILGPSNPEAYELRAMVALAEGKLVEAQAIIRRGARRVGQDEMLAFVAYYWDLFWLPDRELRTRLLQLNPEAFYGDTVWWHIARAGAYLFSGDSVKARADARAAYGSGQALLGNDSTDFTLESRLGLASAYLNRSDDASRHGEAAVALLPIAKDALNGALMVYRLACMQALTGQAEQAVATLETLLSMPFYVSRAWLTIDPNFAGIRDDPSFRRLVRPGH
jgi:serine/threonine-protein kinase